MHTPENMWGGNGWAVAESEDGPGATPTFCVGVDGVGHAPVAWVYRKEDANLIAAAPRLLAACSEAARRLRYSGDLLHDQGNAVRAKADWDASEVCEAAIAKAFQTS